MTWLNEYLFDLFDYFLRGESDYFQSHDIIVPALLVTNKKNNQKLPKLYVIVSLS